jgi:5'-3' exonuclease
MNIGDTYIIRIEVEGKTFTYTGKIISEDNDFITFIDKYNHKWTYNKSKIISFEEVKT